MRIYREFNILTRTASGIPARIALGGDALPDFLFIVVRHEYPFSHLGNRAAAATADIIKGGRADRDARGVRSSGRGVIHGRAIGKNRKQKSSAASEGRRAEDRHPQRIKQCAAQGPADRHPDWLPVARILSRSQPSSHQATARRF